MKLSYTNNIKTKQAYPIVVYHEITLECNRIDNRSDFLFVKASVHCGLLALCFEAILTRNGNTGSNPSALISR